MPTIEYNNMRYILNTVILLCIIDKAVTFYVYTKQNLRRYSNSISEQIFQENTTAADIDNDYPYVVALGGIATPEDALIIFDMYTKNTPVFIRSCSGSLITPRWVLSAQHCVGDMNQGPTVVAYGDTVLPPENKTFSFSKIIKRIPHQTKDIDIGLLLLESGDQVTIVAYGRLSGIDYKVLSGLTVKYVGYGITQFAPSEHEARPSTLKHQAKNRVVGEVLVVPCEHYDSTLRKMGIVVLFKPVICVVPKCSQKQAAALYGDSGGPLLQDGRIVAIFKTWVHHSQPSNTLTPVSPHLGWISRVMSLNS